MGGSLEMYVNMGKTKAAVFPEPKNWFEIEGSFKSMNVLQRSFYETQMITQQPALWSRAKQQVYYNEQG